MGIKFASKLVSTLRSKIIHVLARFVLGGVFIFASIDKIAFPGEFTQIVRNYNLLPAVLVKPFAIILPWAELILGIFLIVGFFVKESALILTSFLVAFVIALIFQATNGPIEDCGCFGKISFLASSNLIILILRDISFLFLGILIFSIQKKL